MEIQNEYSKFTKEELIEKEKKLKMNNKIAIAVTFLSVCNVLVGIYLHKNRGIFTIFLILGGLFFMTKFGTDLKKVQAELKNRNDI